MSLSSIPEQSRRIYLYIPRREIAYFKFVLESYDNLALMSVLDRFEALVCLSFSSHQEEELRELLHELASELTLQELYLPCSGRI